MKKYRLNEALVSYDTFLTKTNESEMTSSMSASATPAPSAASVSDVKVDSDYVSNLSAEIDTIINGLKDISIQLEPEAVEESEDQLNEASSLTDTFFDGDPLFPLLAGGLAGILGIFGLGVKAIKDSKRNKKLGLQVEGDYNKLKTLKVQEVRLEAAIDKLKERQDAFKAETGQTSDAEDSENRTSTSEEPNAAAAKAKAKVRIVSQKLTTQIQTIQKKKEDVSKAIQDFQANLDEKYSEDNLSGFFSGKVRKLIAFKKNEIANTIAELKMKLLADDMDPEEKAKLEETIKKTQEDMQAGLASVQSEDQESEKKVDDNKDKIIAEYDKAIAELENSKGNREGREALVIDMKIVGFEMQKAKLEKDAKKIELFKGKLRELKKEISELGDEESATTEEPAKEEPVKDSKEDKLSRIEDLLKKAEDAGDEAKIQKIKDLKDKIAAKESWQLEGTELSRLFEMEIKKLELSFMLNESMSVKDAFSRLI